MINPQWLELPMSRTIFYGPKDVRAIDIRPYLKLQESNYIFICKTWLFDLFSFSSILQIWYVEVQISRIIVANPFDFEIARVDCIFFFFFFFMFFFIFFFFFFFFTYMELCKLQCSYMKCLN